MAINHFRGAYFFLSSMYPVPGGLEVVEGLKVCSLENAYQAEKIIDADARRRVLEAETGFMAKKLAHTLIREGVDVQEDWDEHKLEVMKHLLSLKFAQGTQLASWLLATGEDQLCEGNDWGDRFWGVSPIGSVNGQNWLGRLLMERREVLESQ